MNADCDHYWLFRRGGTCPHCRTKFPGNGQPPAPEFAFISLDQEGGAMNADIRIEEQPGQEIRIVHRRECDECCGEGTVEVFTCKRKHWHNQTDCMTGEATCEARGCVEGFVDDDECACTECQTIYDGWLERQSVAQEVAHAAH